MGNIALTSAGMALSSVNTAFTWANKPPATVGPGIYFFPDVGINGSLWYNNGAVYTPIGQPILGKKARPGYIVAGLAAANATTYTQSGTTLTVTATGHTLSATLCEGADIYLPILTGAASAGTFSNFAYVDANTFTCQSSVSQTTSGTIATNLTATTALTIPVPGGLMDEKSCLSVYCDPVHNNGAEVKTILIKVGTRTIASIAPTTTYGGRIHALFKNNNNIAKQICFNISVTSNTTQIAESLTSSGAQVLATIDTSVDTNVTIIITVLALSWVMISRADVVLER
jgi:hypothetical protein